MNTIFTHILTFAIVIAILRGPDLVRAENGQVPPLNAPTSEQNQEERPQRGRSNAPRIDTPSPRGEQRQRREQKSEIRHDQHGLGQDDSSKPSREERLSRPRTNVETPRHENTIQRQERPGRSNAASEQPARMNEKRPESEKASHVSEERNSFRETPGRDASTQPRRELQTRPAPHSEPGGENQPREERTRHERQRPEQPRHDSQGRSTNEQRRETGQREDRSRWDRNDGRRDFDRQDRREHDRRHDWDRRPHHVERIYHHLPSRHDIFHHHGKRYHFHSGRYYHLTPLGFVLVRPPVGLIVFSLPIGFRTVISAGFTYYAYGDVYYRRVPAGYEVVQPARSIDRNYPEQVAVDIDLLNVRYGPDTDEAVIAQITNGTILKVLGAAPGWLYIEVQGEDIQGWVMEQYVINISAGRG